MKFRWLLLGVVVSVLLVPAGALTVGRLVEPGGGTWSRLISFTQYAVVLYGLALLLLLVASFAGRGGWRVIARLLGLVALVGLGLHLYWASGPYVGSSAAAAGNGRPFTLMTANLMLGQASPSEVVSTALRDRVDVLVLEEVTPQMLSGMQAAGVDQAFAHSAGSTGGGPAGTMVFSHTPLTGVTRLHTLFNAYRMTVGRPGGGSFTLFAVHPQPPIDDASGWVADQAAIRNAVTGLGDQPAVIAGDFNATLDHQPMRELVGRGFEDSVVEAKSGWQPTWPSPGEVTLFSFPVPTMLQIDHVLVNSGVQALSTQTVTIDGSDHKAVVARLML